MDSLLEIKFYVFKECVLDLTLKIDRYISDNCIKDNNHPLKVLSNKVYGLIREARDDSKLIIDSLEFYYAKLNFAKEYFEDMVID